MDQPSNVSEWLDIAEPAEILKEWERQQAILKQAKDNEMTIRKYIVTDSRGIFGFDRNNISGTERIELDSDTDLKAEKKATYNLTNANGETDEALEHFSDDLAAMLVEWAPKLSVSNYKKLMPEQQAFFNNALTITEGAPTLSFAKRKKR